MKIVDFAYDIESSKEERKASREIGKKLKMRGSFFGGFGYGRVHSHQGQQQAPLGGATSFVPISMSVSTSRSHVGSVS